MSDRYSQLAAALLDIECLMRNQGLWAPQLPSEAAMASTLPFAVDTLAFEEWLQFIFLPRMYQLLSEQLPLPAACVIAPAAEVAFAGSNARTSLLEALRRFDRLFMG